MIVVHENRGLNPHIEDVARRIALEGYLVVAPDALSPVGGTPADQDQARVLISKLDDKANINNFVAAVKYLKTHPVTSILRIGQPTQHPVFKRTTIITLILSPARLVLSA